MGVLWKARSTRFSQKKKGAFSIEDRGRSGASISGFRMSKSALFKRGWMLQPGNFEKQKTKKKCFLPFFAVRVCRGQEPLERGKQSFSSSCCAASVIVCLGYAPRLKLSEVVQQAACALVPRWHGRELPLRISPLWPFLTSILRHNAADTFGHHASRRPSPWPQQKIITTLFSYQVCSSSDLLGTAIKHAMCTPHSI